MRCALTILGYAAGVPLALAAGVGAIAGYFITCDWLAGLAGYSDPWGMIAGAVVLFAMMGAAMGAHACREHP